MTTNDLVERLTAEAEMFDEGYDRGHTANLLREAAARLAELERERDEARGIAEHFQSTLKEAQWFVQRTDARIADLRARLALAEEVVKAARELDFQDWHDCPILVTGNGWEEVEVLRAALRALDSAKDHRPGINVGDPTECAYCGDIWPCPDSAKEPTP